MISKCNAAGGRSRKSAIKLLCRLSFLILLLASAFAPQVSGEEVPSSGSSYAPLVLPASEDAAQAIEGFQIPEGAEVSLFAAEPMLANPVAFCVDHQGRFYVAETFRHSAGVTDTRGHMYWVEDDLACRTVADRVAMFRKHLGDQIDSYATEHDRVRMIVDTDGDGTADRATVFADGFSNVPDGIGAGLLARDGKVWYSCIPSLWELQDRNEDGVADEQTALHTGFGVHVGFLGHDLHGLRMGPDGRLYFSIGDRGLHVKTEDGLIDLPDTGSVLRCNPDGTNLEVFAFGLRNPQELVFDDFGNLFTGDNNSDGGDKARWVYVVEGGDSGWRIGYQFLRGWVPRGPWNAEKLWHPQFDGQAAYIVPPIINLADGPSGLTYNPGTGFPSRYDGHFFLCDFRGTQHLSGIRSFAVRPKGASFELIDEEKFLWSVLATDVDFGPDGAMYVTDWVEGWQKPGKGRIYRVAFPGITDSTLSKQVARMLGEGMRHRSTAELATLLSHADQRIRQEAQFALVERGTQGLAVLEQAARSADHLLARLHGMWGLGQIARRDNGPQALLIELLSDPNAEVRAQACKVIGDAPPESALHPLIGRLNDSEPRVQFFAAIALGNLGRPEAVKGLLAMLENNTGGDPYLRHAAVMGLYGSATPDALLNLAKHASTAVRMGVLLALRRHASPHVATFLDDDDLAIVAEAARAINDVPITDALPQLAALIEDRPTDEMLLRRVVNANFRLGGADRAEALVDLALDDEVLASVREEVLECLAQWSTPGPLDRIVGLWRPLPSGDADEAPAAVLPAIDDLLATDSDRVREASARLAGTLRLTPAAATLANLVTSEDQPTKVRVEALRALEALDTEHLKDAVLAAVESKKSSLRNEGRKLLAKISPEDALPVLIHVLEDGRYREQQSALMTLGEMQGPEVDTLLVEWMDRLLDGNVPDELHLELLTAAGKRDAEPIKQRVDQFEKNRDTTNPASAYVEALSGGDSFQGKKIFTELASVSCLRCHDIPGAGLVTGGGTVGPPLNEIGAKQDRQYLLEAIVAPNSKIAKGFETVVVTTDEGQVHIGVLKEETDTELRLMTAQGASVTIDKSTIDERERGASAMPDTIKQQLTKFQIRDLVEYLSRQKK